MYVGSAEDEKYDQELDSVLVGPNRVGKNKFIFTAPAPNHKLIPTKDLMEVTVLLLTCSYHDKEFIRIGYYVNNEYPQEEIELLKQREDWFNQCNILQQEYQNRCNQIRSNQEELDQLHQQQPPAADSDALSAPAALTLPDPPVLPPQPGVDISKLQRNILADKPRVTRFQISWDDNNVDASGSQNDFSMNEEDEKKANEMAAQGETQSASAIPNASGPTGNGMQDDDDDDDEEDEDEDEEDEESQEDVDMDDGEEEEEEEEDEDGEEEEEEQEGGNPLIGSPTQHVHKKN